MKVGAAIAAVKTVAAGHYVAEKSKEAYAVCQEKGKEFLV